MGGLEVVCVCGGVFFIIAGGWWYCSERPKHAGGVVEMLSSAGWRVISSRFVETKYNTGLAQEG